jgi:hypothetical protein
MQAGVITLSCHVPAGLDRANSLSYQFYDICGKIRDNLLARILHALRLDAWGGCSHAILRDSPSCISGAFAGSHQDERQETHMHISAVLCRQREAHHRQIATQSQLANVRKVALAAALAWAHEAELAEAHEAGHPTALSAQDAEIALEFLEEDMTGYVDDKPDSSPT